MEFGLIKIILVCHALAFILLMPVNSVKAETLHLVGEVYPPGTYEDGSGQQFELVRNIFEQLGYQVKISVFPYKRAIKLVETGQADMMVGMLKDTSLKVNYSYYPHDVDNLLAIYPRANKTQWQGSSSIHNKHLTMLLGLSEPFKPSLPDFDYQVTEVKTHEQALKKLFFGRTDFIIDSEGSFLLLYEAKDREKLYAQLVGFIEIYAAFSNKPNGIKAKKLWDAHFKDFIQTNRAENIYAKWGMHREYWITQQFITDKLLKNSNVKVDTQK